VDYSYSRQLLNPYFLITFSLKPLINYLSPMRILFVFFSIFLCGLCHSQNFSWSKQFAASSASRGDDIVIDAAGNVYTTGALNGTVDMDPGPGVYNLTQSAGSGAFIS